MRVSPIAERRARELLRRLGFTVYRLRAPSLADFIAFHKRSVVIVRVGKSKRRKHENRRLIAEAAKIDADVFRLYVPADRSAYLEAIR